MLNNKRLFLDVHAIQTVPPSNINRDDTGSPKTAQYGGVTRARVSSQSWKKAIRQYFLEYGDLGNVGVRSLEIVRYVADKIVKLDESIALDEAMNLAEKVIKDAGITTTKERKTRALFFISSVQAEKLAKAAIEGDVKKAEIQKLLKEDPAIDIALFGRMVADDPNLNEDASSQFAHAISTHGVQTEFDFFTATDDFSSATDAGAGMLGTVEYNSSTLYRYANVAVHEFSKQIADKPSIINALKLFIEAFTKSMPTGKINTFANQTLPQALLITLRSDRPVSLVTAFERPIRSNEGYVEKSIQRLEKEYQSVQQWLDAPLYSYSLGMPNLADNQASLSALLEKLEETLDSLLDS